MKITQIFILTFLVFSINFLLVLNASADNGRLMDQYPPGVKAENFKLHDINGNTHELNMFRGKYVLINFWAMSCNVCKSEMTTLQSAYDLINSDDFAILAIHAGDNTDGVAAVIKINEITYPVLIDSQLELGGWGVPILPTTFIVDPEGNILYRAVGTRVWNSPFMVDFLQNMVADQEMRVSQLD